MLHIVCKCVQGLQLCWTQPALQQMGKHKAWNGAAQDRHAQGLQIYSTGLANLLHRACKYVARGIKICCTGPADMLHRTWKYVAQICCTGPTNMLPRACKYDAQGPQICCTGPAIIMHRACKYVAQGVQIYCTGPANMLRGACRYDDEPINILHRAYKYTAFTWQDPFCCENVQSSSARCSSIWFASARRT